MMNHNILIISPSWIGDCVMTQPLLRHLKNRHPECRIDVFAPQWSMAVFERMPEADRLLANPFGHGALELRHRWHLGSSFRQHNYHQAIVLPGSLKSALLPFAARIPQRTGYVGESRYLLLNDIRRLDKQALPLMVDRYTALAYPKGQPFTAQSGYPSLSISTESQTQALSAQGLHTDRPIIAFCPGAEYGSAKRWPTQHFATLAQYCHEAGKQVWIFGSQKDAPLGDEIRTLSGGHAINLCGRTSLAEAIDLIALAESVVCNDSGLMHIAAAAGRKLVAIYGSSSPTHTPPLSDQAKILSLNLECSPCFKRECPLGHTRCLNDISPEMVWHALQA